MPLKNRTSSRKKTSTGSNITTVNYFLPSFYSKEDSHWDYLTDINACSALLSSRHLIPVQYLVHLLCLLDNWNGSNESLNLAIHSYLELLFAHAQYHAPNDIGKIY